MVSLSTYESIVGSLSATASFAVILTYYMFRDLRNLRYVELVLYVSINDFIGSIGIALGAQPDGSIGCGFQAFVSNANYLSATFWTTIIAYQVYLVVVHKQILKNMTSIHLFCWLVPAIVTLLPLTTSSYGNNDDQESWCFIANNGGNSTRVIWLIFGFYFWLWCGIALSLYFVCHVQYSLTNMETVNEILLVGTVRRLVYYPVIFSVCWVLATVLDLYLIYNDLPNGSLWNTINVLSNLLAIFPGILLSILFFYQNPFVVNRWKEYFNNVQSKGVFNFVLKNSEIQDSLVNPLVYGTESSSGSDNNNNDNNNSTTKDTIKESRPYISEFSALEIPSVSTKNSIKLSDPHIYDERTMDITDYIDYIEPREGGGLSGFSTSFASSLDFSTTKMSESSNQSNTNANLSDVVHIRNSGAGLLPNMFTDV